MKYIPLLVLLAFHVHAFCQAGISQTTTVLTFEWSNDSLNGLFFEKTAMHIPVHVENDTNTYYLQLDTGSDQTFLYECDSVRTNLPVNALAQNTLNTDIGLIKAVKLKGEKCYPEDGKIHIGTLGADFFANKIVEIDFPGQQLRFLQSYDSTSFQMGKMKLSYGRPVIQLVSENDSYDFMFDTGSSLFELWTTKSLWKKFRDKSAPIDEFPISSWGKMNSAYRSPLKSNLSVSFCGSIPIMHVWYNSNKQFAKGFRTIHLDGIIGNKPFLDKVVLLDFENEKMGVKNVQNNK